MNASPKSEPLGLCVHFPSSRVIDTDPLFAIGYPVESGHRKWKGAPVEEA
jgi:hypothetical protein